MHTRCCLTVEIVHRRPDRFSNLISASEIRSNRVKLYSSGDADAVAEELILWGIRPGERMDLVFFRTGLLFVER